MGGSAEGAVSSGTRQMGQAAHCDATQGPVYTSPPCGTHLWTETGSHRHVSLQLERVPSPHWQRGHGQAGRAGTS